MYCLITRFMTYVADRIQRVYSRKNRAKPVGPDVFGPEHFNYIFGLWQSGLTHLVNTTMKSSSGWEQFTTKFPGAVSNRNLV
ncbi:hypothetical protein Hanom_Chr07g00611611 [Helianthus anomalus]